MNNFLFLPTDALKIYEVKVPLVATPLWKYWDEFVEKYLRSGKSEVTVRSVRDILRFCVRQANLLTVEACNNPRLVEDTLHALKKERNFSAATYNTYLKGLNTYFLWLEKMEYISQNKLQKVTRCKEVHREQLVLTEDQVSRIVGQVHTRRQTRLERLRNVLFIDLMRFTAARPCELLGMHLQDFEKDNDTYKVIIRGRKQKGRVRHYRSPSFLRDSFEAYRTYRNYFRDNEHVLLISSSKRTGWTDKGMRGLFKKLSQELGFQITAYAFRRYVATKLYKEGVPLEQIKNYLGHTRITTTMRYIERSCFLTNEGAKIMGIDQSVNKEER